VLESFHRAILCSRDTGGNHPTKPENLMMCLIELLTARKRQGVTQAQLGKDCGVSENLICKIETQRRTPSRVLAEKIARRLNTKPEDLFPQVK